MKPINKRDNDWFFDKLETHGNKMLDNPGKGFAKLAGIALVINILWFLFVVGVITGAVILVLSLV